MHKVRAELSKINTRARKRPAGSQDKEQEVPKDKESQKTHSD